MDRQGWQHVSVGDSGQGITPALTTQRLDVLTSYSVRDWEFAGGAWVSSGYAVGGKPGGWGTIGIPLASDMLITIGADYSPITWTADPRLRGLISIRHITSVGDDSAQSVEPVLPGGEPRLVRPHVLDKEQTAARREYATKLAQDAGLVANRAQNER